MKKIIKLLLLAALVWPSIAAAQGQEATQKEAARVKLSSNPLPGNVPVQQEFPKVLDDQGELMPACEGDQKDDFAVPEGFVANPFGAQKAPGDGLRVNQPARAPIETSEKVTRYRWTNKTLELSSGGNGTNQYVPLNLYYLENSTCHGQAIYPSSQFSGMSGKRIKSITFHANSNLTASTGSTYSLVTLSLGETTQTRYTDATFLTGLSHVAKVAKILNGGTEITFELTYPYTYNGGNLVVDMEGDGSGDAYAAQSVAWKGVTNSNYYYSVYSYGSNNTTGRAPFRPYITIVYEEEEAVLVDAPVSGDKNFFQAIEYTWPINMAEANRPAENKATLDEVATDPDQMIALLHKVYTDTSIPGNYKRGYTADGHAEPYDDVAYTGVGRIRHSGSDYTTGYTYSDNSGWAVPGDIVAKVGPLTTSSGNTVYYAHMDSTQYKPDQEGVTLLLIEMRDDYTTDGMNAAVSAVTGTGSYTNYDVLKARVGYAFKSIRVLTESKRTGQDFEAGTLFKIDCDKMNKFFMVAKGQARYPFNSNHIFNEDGYFNKALTFCRLPLYGYSSDYYYQGNGTDHEGWFDTGVGTIFRHMYEQFSPYDLNDENSDVTDIYKNLVDMNSFYVAHDCINVPTATPAATEAGGHHFRMYGDDSKADDCQDVRDLMFFVPDYRMMHFSGQTMTTTGSVTVADGSDGSTTTTNKYVPIYGYYYDEAGTYGQMLYPSTMLNDLAGKKIKSITFYPSTTIAFSGGAMTVTMGTTSSASYDGQILTPSGAVSKTITPTYGDSELTITFDNPYTYTAGTNLLVNMEVTTAGEWGSMTWRGIETETYQSADYNSADGLYANYFLPTIKFTYEETTTEGGNRDVGNGTGYTAQNVKYQNYNPKHRPTMGLYVIKQDPITCPDDCQQEEYYKLTLTWDSNMDEFLPGEQQKYHLLQLVQDELGNDIYVPVYYTNANGEYTDASGHVLSNQNDTTSWVPVTLVMDPSADKKTYTDVYVRRLSGSQQVTYAIQGRDTGHFLSLQISNQQSYIVPGTDPAEMAILSDATNYSRFNPQTQHNCYSNRMVLRSNPNAIKSDYVAVGTVIKVKRMLSENDEGEVIATARVRKLPDSEDSGKMDVTMAGQVDKTEFPSGMSDDPVVNYAGYHANIGGEGNCTWSHSFFIRDGFVNLGELQIYDNFTADVSDNNHPVQYFYKVEFTTATPFQGLNGSTSEAYSNSFRVPVYKTDSRINLAYDKATVDADGVQVEGSEAAPVRMELPENVQFDELVRRSSKTEILRYDTYRWNSEEPADFFIINKVYADDDEQDLPPHGIAGNQGEYYTVSMNAIGTDDYMTSETSVASGQGWAQFVDKVPQAAPEASSYTYAPVIELFSKGVDVTGLALRSDYNNYGGPLQKVAVGKVDAEVVTETDENGKECIHTSEVSWEQNGKEYCFYNLPVRLKVFDIPAGYEVYKVRAWRLIDSELLGERPADSGYPDRTYRLSDDYLFEELTYGDEKNGEFDADGMRAAKLSGYELGGRKTGYYDERKATFGAVKLQGTETMPYQIIVRVYFTKANADAAVQPAGGPRRALTLENLSADGKYYVAEKVISDEIKGTNIITGINGVKADLSREVESVNYVNTMGQVANRPWQGVNVVVTRYTDGTTKTTKAVY